MSGEDAKKLAAEVKPGESRFCLRMFALKRARPRTTLALAKAMADMADDLRQRRIRHRAPCPLPPPQASLDYLPAVCGFLIKKEISIMGRR
ncbi:MAG: hypothetical protein ACLR4Z_15440 [Butyricicoccaceae bacterium]